MTETYEIRFRDRAVGTARMEKEGLYYRFCCRCALPDEGMYRIHVICGNDRQDLGICIPVDGMFGTDKRIPAKRLAQGQPDFELVPKDWIPPAEEAPEPEPEKIFVPVCEDAPVEHLDKLENAVLAEQDGQIGFLIEE